MIIIIDNYDSFVYNLYQYVGEITDKVKVYRNDEISIEEIERQKPSGIILSPGPGRPEDAGICTEVVKEFKGKIPILGICLGHQAIGHALGGNVVRCKEIMHGKTSVIKVKQDKIFEDIEDSLTVMRYHSLVIERASLPKDLKISAETEDGVIMAVSHEKYDVFGLQFHPESILTQAGKKMIKNFVRGICHVS